MKESFVFYESFYQAIKDLNNDIKAEFVTALCEYCLYGNEIELQPFTKALFIAVKPTIDNALKRYYASVENGKKGGRPKKPNDNPTKTQQKPKQNLEKPNDNLYVDVDVDVDDNNILVVEEEEKKNENFYGEYYNVFLTDKHYKDLEVLIMNKKKLNEIINDLSVNIETGKENKYSSDLPNAHYERIKAYFNYRKKNPKNFVTEPDKKTTEEILKEMGLKFKTI